MLHKCEDIENADLMANDDECLAKLAQYRAYKVLGAGIAGVALHVAHEKFEQSLVIKIMDRNNTDAQREVKTACRVDARLARNDRTFSRVYGWIACNGSNMPEQWKELIMDYQAEFDFDPFLDDCFFLVSEYGQGIPLERYTFDSPEDCKSFFFEVIYSLMNAFENHKFHHNDLHSGNILYLPGPFPPRKYYNVNIVSTGRPMIIDYGLSWFGEPLEPARAYEEEYVEQHIRNKRFSDAKIIEVYMEFLMPREHYKFDNRHGVLRDIYKLCVNLEGNNYWVKKLYDFAKKTQSFDQVLKFIYPIVDFLHVGQNASYCHVCGEVDVTHELKQASSYRFCNQSRCIKAMSGIGNLIGAE